MCRRKSLRGKKKSMMRGRNKTDGRLDSLINHQRRHFGSETKLCKR